MIRLPSSRHSIKINPPSTPKKRPSIHKEYSASSTLSPSTASSSTSSEANGQSHEYPHPPSLNRNLPPSTSIRRQQPPPPPPRRKKHNVNNISPTKPHRSRSSPPTRSSSRISRMRSDFNRERSKSGEQHRRDNKKDDRDHRSLSTPHQWSSSSRVRSSSMKSRRSSRNNLSTTKQPSIRKDGQEKEYDKSIHSSRGRRSRGRSRGRSEQGVDNENLSRRSRRDIRVEGRARSSSCGRESVLGDCSLPLHVTTRSSSPPRRRLLLTEGHQEVKATKDSDNEDDHISGEDSVSLVNNNHDSNRRRQDSTRGEGRRHTTESLTALFKKTVDEHRSRHSRRRGNDVHRDSVVEHKRSKSCDTRNKAPESNKSESRRACDTRTRGRSGHKNEARKGSNEEVKTVGRSQASTSSYQYTTQPHRSRKDRQGRDQRHDITSNHKRPQGMKAPPPPPPRKLPVEKDTPDSSSRSTSNATSQSKALSYVHNLQCSDRTGGGAGLYTGEVDQWRRPHGQGFMKYTTGQFYEGTFCNGEPNAFEFQQQNLPQSPLLLMYNM